jgi:uncharacterized cupin superfamily protein
MRHLEEQGVIELIAELRGYYSKYHLNCKKQQQFYDQEITLPKQLKGMDVHVPPTARTIINTGVDTLMSLDHLITILLWKETTSAKSTVSKLKRFDKAYLGNISKTMRYNVRRTAMKHGLLYGEFDIKGPIYVPRFAPTKLPAETPDDFRVRCDVWENSLDKTFPFVHRIQHPLNVLWDPNPEPEFVCEDYMRQSREILSAHPDWQEKYGIPTTGWVRWQAFYGKDEKRYIVAGKTVYDGDNVVGIPYERGNAGFGNEDETGSPEKAFCGILAPALKTIKSDIILRTTILMGLQYAVWGKPTINAQAGTAGVYKPTNVPGETSQIADGYNYRNLAPNQLSPEVWRVLGMFDQDTQQIMPNSSFGSLSKGMTSGAMMATSIIQGRQALTELKSQWELVASSMCNRLHLLLKYVVQEPVGILGTLATGGTSVMKLYPNQLHPDVQVTNVMLDPMTPEERTNRINLGLLILRSNAASEETICENYLGLDYQQEASRKLIEKIMKNPIVENKMSEIALEQAGMMEVFDLLKQQGFNVPQQDGYNTFDAQSADPRRAQPGMQEVWRQSDYNHNQLTPGSTVNGIPHREVYGQGDYAQNHGQPDEGNLD